MLPLWGAFLVGLAYGLPLGPVFIVALHQTERRGTRAGAGVWLGSLSGDLLLFAAGLWGAAPLRGLLESVFVRQLLGAGAGVLFLALGVSLLRVAPPATGLEGAQSGIVKTGTFRWRDWATGFSVNTLNIGNGLFWLGIAAASTGWVGPFLGLLGVLPTFALKHWLCVEMTRRMRPMWMLRVMRVSGILLLGLGGFSLYQSWI